MELSTDMKRVDDGAAGHRDFPLAAVESRPGAGALHVHPRTAARLGIRPGPAVTVACSDRTAAVSVRLDPAVAEGTLALPDDVLRRLGLGSPVATRLRYRVKGGGDAIELGPVIGILANVRPGEMPRPRDHGYKVIHAVWNAEELGGLIYFFAPGDIDWVRREVRGFVHVPGKIQWEEGRFPFPTAIYRRTTISSDLEEHIKWAITPHMFNPVALGNKLRQHQLLGGRPEFQSHLPETRALDGEDTFADMVRRYRRVYVKNTHRGAGKGVFLVEALSRKHGYRVRMRDRSEAGSGPNEREVTVPSFEALMDTATAVVGRPWSPRHWLVQQPIPLARYEGRPFDVRVNVQKNGDGEWTIPGHVVRIAPEEGSAVTRLGRYRQVSTVVGRLWPKRKEDILERIESLSIRLCQALEEELGLMGDVGVDIALDGHGHPWFLEANPRPCHRLRSADQLSREYWRKVFTPLLYASYLSGFPVRFKDMSRVPARVEGA